MNFSRHVLMGDPASFKIKHGANPHTRNRWGFKKRVDSGRAKAQWQVMKETLESYDVKVHVLPAQRDFPGLVFPANAGYVPRLEPAIPLTERTLILSHLNPARSGEMTYYQAWAEQQGMKTATVSHQFEGQADLIAWQENYLFTFGRLTQVHWKLRFGVPPWQWVFGFRTDERAIHELRMWVPLERVVHLELSDERFYHGDTVLCAFGPHREYLLFYRAGLMPASSDFIKASNDIIELSDADAHVFAANSFQIIRDGACILFMPAGISMALQDQIERKGIEVVRIDVSEFLHKGGGAVKCMVLDLGLV